MQLEARFGELEPPLKEEIKSFDTKKLKDLGLAQLNFGSKTDLISWLKNILNKTNATT